MQNPSKSTKTSGSSSQWVCVRGRVAETIGGTETDILKGPVSSNTREVEVVMWIVHNRLKDGGGGGPRRARGGENPLEDQKHRRICCQARGTSFC